MSRTRRRLTYANVMSTIAAFPAIGGTSAFAATQLGRGSVGTKQLKYNSVTPRKLAPEAVRAGRLAKNSVAADRLRHNCVSASLRRAPSCRIPPRPHTPGPDNRSRISVFSFGCSATETKHGDPLPTEKGLGPAARVARREGASAERTGYAVRHNSVGPGKLAPEAVHAGRLAKNSIVSNRLRDDSVNGSKIVAGAVGTQELADGAVSAAKLGPINVRPTAAWIGASSTGQVAPKCGAGERLIGSGGYWSPVAEDGHSIESAFDYAGNTAVVRGNDATAAPSVLTVQAICLG